MKLFIKTTLVLSFAAVLTACGGGGDGGSSSTATGKYAGTHSYCDGDHTRYRLVLTETVNGNYSVLDSEVTYQNSNCTGNVLATYSATVPSIATFVETSVAPIRVPDLASSLSLDKYKLNVPQSTATLTGSGVTGNCVNYPGGRFCYDLSSDAYQVDLGLYLTSAGFYGLILEDGVYAGDLYVKE
jgi:hypothetical protein